MTLTSDDKLLICFHCNPIQNGNPTLKIFDFETKQQILEQSLGKDVRYMTLTPDNKFILLSFQRGASIKMIPLEPMHRDHLGKFFKSLTEFIVF